MMTSPRLETYMRQSRRPAVEATSVYLRWLADERLWSLEEARIYAMHGQAEMIKYHRNGPPDPTHCPACHELHRRGKASPHPPAARSGRERQLAIEANARAAGMLAFGNLDIPCNKVAGCQLPAAHSGPCRNPRFDLDAMPAAFPDDRFS